MLRKYHQILWSRELPCGEKMELTDGKSRYYLKWKDFYFGSDSILVSFRHSDRKAIGMRKRFFIITYLLWHIIRTNSVSLFRNCKFQFLESFLYTLAKMRKYCSFSPEFIFFVIYSNSLSGITSLNNGPPSSLYTNLILSVSGEMTYEQ